MAVKWVIHTRSIFIHSDKIVTPGWLCTTIEFAGHNSEFSRAALEALRQPLETGRVSIARANSHVTYPARVQLIAAMNPCRCGYLAEPGRACGRAPKCAQDYTSRLSGPLLDRIDMHIDVPAVSPADLGLPPPAETSAEIARRVAAARARQSARYAALPADRRISTNAEADGALLDEIATPGGGRPGPPAARRRAPAPLGARLPPGAACRPHPRRPRRRPRRHPPPHRRGALLPPAPQPAGKRRRREQQTGLKRRETRGWWGTWAPRGGPPPNPVPLRPLLNLLDGAA